MESKLNWRITFKEWIKLSHCSQPTLNKLLKKHWVRRKKYKLPWKRPYVLIHEDDFNEMIQEEFLLSN